MTQEGVTSYPRELPGVMGLLVGQGWQNPGSHIAGRQGLGASPGREERRPKELWRGLGCWEEHLGGQRSESTHASPHQYRVHPSPASTPDPGTQSTEYGDHPAHCLVEPRRGDQLCSVDPVTLRGQLSPRWGRMSVSGWRRRRCVPSGRGSLWM